MEVPKKIYLTPDIEKEYKELERDWYIIRISRDAIEYTRTDAFIEKALKWYCLDCECNDNCKDTKCFFYREYERYLKGEMNALPPKFADRILNEDGSTSDNWRYRHFTSKMQDAFIEKAWSFIEDNFLSANQQDNCELYRKQFIKAMKL